MKQVCFTLKIDKENVQKYLDAHKVWPEMLEAIKAVGIQDYSLFIDKDGLIVGCLEAEDPQASFTKLGQTEVNARWQKHMAQFFGGSDPDMGSGSLKWLDQYFYLK